MSFPFDDKEDMINTQSVGHQGNQSRTIRQRAPVALQQPILRSGHRMDFMGLDSASNQRGINFSNTNRGLYSESDIPSNEFSICRPGMDKYSLPKSDFNKGEMGLRSSEGTNFGNKEDLEIGFEKLIAYETTVSLSQSDYVVPIFTNF